MQQRNSSSNPGEESSSTYAGVMGRTLKSFLRLQQQEHVAGPQPTYLGTVCGLTVCRDWLSTSVWSWLLLRRYLDTARMVEGQGLTQREG